MLQPPLRFVKKILGPSPSTPRKFVTCARHQYTLISRGENARAEQVLFNQSQVHTFIRSFSFTSFQSTFLYCACALSRSHFFCRVWRRTDDSATGRSAPQRISRQVHAGYRRLRLRQARCDDSHARRRQIAYRDPCAEGREECSDLANAHAL